MTRTTNFASISTATVSNGIVGQNTLEFRATLSNSKIDNKVQFVYHGGRITLGKNGLFGEFRPMPIVMGADRQPKINDAGNVLHSTTWIANVVEKGNDLSEQDKALLAIAIANPTIAAIMPAHIQEAMAIGTGLVHEQIDWATLLQEIVDIENVKFTFSIPSEFTNVVEQIKDLVTTKEKGQNYSIVIRFDAGNIRADGELKEEYNSDVLRKDLKITPTYIGFIDGCTSTETNNSKLIAPIVISNAISKAKVVAQDKVVSPYLDQAFLQAQSAKVKERLATIGTGKKSHQPIVAAIYDSSTKEEFNENVEVLNALAERCTNNIVTTSYVENIVTKAIAELVFD